MLLKFHEDAKFATFWHPIEIYSCGVVQHLHDMFILELHLFMYQIKCDVQSEENPMIK